MNDNNENNVQYRATSNLNTAIDNPQINVDDVNDVNVENVNNNSYLNTNNGESGFLNNSYSTESEIINDNNVSANEVYNNQINYDLNDKNSDTYEPTLEEKNNSSEGISSIFHSKELKIIIFILFLLCIFLLLMPYIYDFIVNIRTS